MHIHILVDNNTIIDSYYLGEPAVSYWITTGNKNILFDVGYSDVFIKNARQMNIDIDLADYIVISHGHNDHTGGLTELIARQKDSHHSSSQPTLIAHPEAFSYKVYEDEVIGSPVSIETLKNTFNTRLSSEPVWLTDKLVFLGEIERTNDYENKEPIGKCKNNNHLTDDFVKDDSALAYRSDDGLVIITGCSHAGICNILEQAKTVCDDDRIADIIGGFHLLDPSNEQLKGTLNYFSQLDTKTIHPCHCTSLQAKIELSKYIAIEEVGVGTILSYQEAVRE